MKAQDLGVSVGGLTAVMVLNQDWTPNVAVVTDSTNDAGAVVVLEVELIPDQWIPVELENKKTGANAASLTGASQYGTAAVPGAQRARAKRTDSAGGVCLVAIGQMW